MQTLGGAGVVAEAKDGTRLMLDEKWAKVFKATCPRGVFTTIERRSAA